MTENRDTFFKRLKGNFSVSQINQIGKAYRMAKNLHRPQKRDDGARYFEHPRSVAIILMDELQIYDKSMIISALLHDVPEDCFITIEEIEEIFGKEVKYTVDFLSKFKIHADGLEIVKEKKKDYFKKLKASDWKTRIVKLCDRLHNMRTLKGCLPEKQERKLQETKKLYLPLAKKTNKTIADLLNKEVKKMEEATHEG